MNISNVSFEIKENEYFYNLNRIPGCPTTIQANIPKLMPQIPKGIPSVGTMGVNPSIFCNDASCKPSVSCTVQTQNYVTLRKHRHEQPDYSIDIDYPPGPNQYLIDRYHKFVLNILHADIRQMYFSTK